MEAQRGGPCSLVRGRVRAEAHHLDAALADLRLAADAGKSVYYLLRWVSTKGQPGPWSDVVTAKIPL